MPFPDAMGERTIRLPADGAEYDYHAGSNRALLYCENPAPPVMTTKYFLSFKILMKFGAGFVQRWATSCPPCGEN
ncbi:MAG: hypothetical protein DRR42_24575 [Gammaproteobacteria bacterium]|nr:MAG: hypothetical protein DRR42_24575 [Gammaproteobacteria bacterium]